MRWLKKYVSILFLLSVFPLAWVSGSNFITLSDNEIYEFIPQESDIVIEVNNVNFISEFAYQRVYNQDYVFDKIDFEEVESETGINYFSKIILFREQWADEYVWFAVLKYTKRKDAENYVKTKLKHSRMAFGNGHMIIQLSESVNQDEMNKRLGLIAGKEVKPFTARVDLDEIFKSDKEINCYFIPPSGEYQNQLIEGYLNLDFKQDHVDIDGEFTPVSGFESTPNIAYALNEESAFSMRSSLNIFNSIYWFSKEKIENVPEYEQLALDYDGVNMFMVDATFDYSFPFKQYPQMDLRFDLIHPEDWQAFWDTLIAHETIRIDTTTNGLATSEGTFFKYNFNEDVFELGRNKNVQFAPSTDENVCFDMQLKIGQLIENTKFSVDEDNPPGTTFQMFGMAAIDEMMEDLMVLSNVEQIKFKLVKTDDDKVHAEGIVQMENRSGQSEIECYVFAKESIYFISETLEIVTSL